MKSNLLENILSTIRRLSMLKPGDRVLVAVSGGPDSVALLHALYSLRDELGITLHAAHLNHSFRGKESDADAEYVAQLAGNLGVPCTVEKIDVPEIQRTLRLSPEEAARLVRYEFLERVADEIAPRQRASRSLGRANRIAVGHTADDQVETVLLNILRGAGIDGLSGMPPVRGRIIRPLIETRRSVVEEYVERQGLHPRIDATNLLATYARNRIRLELLPLLRREYNPEVDAAILRLSELATEDSAYLNMEAEETLARLKTSQNEQSLSLDVPGLLECRPAIRRRVIRSAVSELRGGLADVGFVHVEDLLRLLDGGKDFRYELPGGIYVERARETLTLSSSKREELPIIYCYELCVPGKTEVPEIGVIIEVDLSQTPVEPMRPPDSLEVVLDRDSIVGKLKVRSWEPGDRIRPLGLGGSKKIQDIFVDKKIPRAARHRVPIMADDEKVVWIAGLALSDLVKVTDRTREFLVLRSMPA